MLSYLGALAFFLPFLPLISGKVVDYWTKHFIQSDWK